MERNDGLVLRQDLFPVLSPGPYEIRPGSGGQCTSAPAKVLQFPPLAGLAGLRICEGFSALVHSAAI